MSCFRDSAPPLLRLSVPCSTMPRNGTFRGSLTGSIGCVGHLDAVGELGLVSPRSASWPALCPCVAKCPLSTDAVWRLYRLGGWGTEERRCLHDVISSTRVIVLLWENNLFYSPGCLLACLLSVRSPNACCQSMLWAEAAGV